MSVRLRFYHYAADEIKFIPKKYEQVEKGHSKPLGFWLSVGADWARWSRGENFRTETLKTKHEVFLADDARILYISTKKQLDRFTAEYGSEHPESSNAHIRQMERGKYPKWQPINMWGDEMTDQPYTMDIDWRKVAEKYQGIVIAPYIHERRLAVHTSWYYGWDCASGCIWDTDAIHAVIKVDRKARVKK